MLVFSQITRSDLRREQTTAKTICDKKKTTYYIGNYLDLPNNRLISKHPIWSHFQLLDHHTTLNKNFEKNVLSARFLIMNLLIILQFFFLERREWSLLKRL